MNTKHGVATIASKASRAALSGVNQAGRNALTAMVMMKIANRAAAQAAGMFA